MPKISSTTDKKEIDGWLVMVIFNDKTGEKIAGSASKGVMLVHRSGEMYMASLAQPFEPLDLYDTLKEAQTACEEALEARTKKALET